MRYLLVVVIAFAAACAPAGEDNARRALFQGALDDAVPGDIVDLVDVLGSDWEQVAVIGPYYNNEVVADMLGIPFDYERAATWQSSEGGHLVVLTSSDAVVAWFNVPWEVDIGCLDGQVFTAGAATLGVAESATFGKVVGPSDDPYCYLD